MIAFYVRFDTAGYGIRCSYCGYVYGTWYATSGPASTVGCTCHYQVEYATVPVEPQPVIRKPRWTKPRPPVFRRRLPPRRIGLPIGPYKRHRVSFA